MIIKNNKSYGVETKLVGEKDPVLEHINITENGTYQPREGVDGFNEVTVSVSGGGGSDEQFAKLISGESYNYTIPEGVTHLKDRAFAASGLVSLPLGLERVESTGTLVFADNPNLEEVDIPEGCVGLDNAFQGCNNLHTIYYPEHTQLSEEAFRIIIPRNGVNVKFKSNVARPFPQFPYSWLGGVIEIPYHHSKEYITAEGCYSLVYPSKVSTGIDVDNFCNGSSGCYGLVFKGGYEINLTYSEPGKIFGRNGSLNHIIVKKMPYVYTDLEFTIDSDCGIYVEDRYLDDYKSVRYWRDRADMIRPLSSLAGYNEGEYDSPKQPSMFYYDVNREDWEPVWSNYDELPESHQLMMWRGFGYDSEMTNCDLSLLNDNTIRVAVHTSNQILGTPNIMLRERSGVKGIILPDELEIFGRNQWYDMWSFKYISFGSNVKAINCDTADGLGECEDFAISTLEPPKLKLNGDSEEWAGDDMMSHFQRIYIKDEAMNDYRNHEQWGRYSDKFVSYTELPSHLVTPEK